MQTIGERLEEARKRKGISIREAAEATKIRGDYLHKYENNQFDIKLPDIYVRGFLRIYATYLKLPGDKIMADYQALGLGEGGRPQGGRSLNREIYGKMEISRASANGANKGGADEPGTAEAGAGGGEGSAQARVPFQPRMPLGGLDRAMLAKNGLWIGLVSVVVVGLVVWGVVAFLGGGSEPTPSAETQIEDPVYIVALAPVQVISVKSRLDGRDLANARSLVAGERYAVPNADMLINVSERSAVQFEHGGTRYGAGDNTGPGPLALNFTSRR